MHGGGPPQLRSVSEVRSCTNENAGTHSHLADFEASSFSAALKHVLQKFVDECREEVSFDVTSYLELELQFAQGLMCITGPYEMLRLFMDCLIRSGMERCLAFCGWMTACHFTSVFDPVVAEIVFFRKPSTPAVSIDFVQAFIQCALVTLAMPCLRTEAQDAMKTRLKLWGVSMIDCRGTFQYKTFWIFGIRLPPSPIMKR